MKLVAKSKKEHFLTILLYSLLLLFLFLSSFFKASSTIVMPYFMDEMNLSHSFTGLVSGMFFFPYAVMQLFTGPLTRKIGTVRLLCLGIILATIGTLQFAFPQGAAFLIAGRFLLGLGLSPVFICLISFQQQNFIKEDYAKAFGIQIMTNNLGAACASAPLKWLLGKMGMRVFFCCTALVLLLMGILLFTLDCMIHRDEEEKTSNESIRKILWISLKTIWHSRILIAVLIVRTMVNSITATFQTLWGTPWTEKAFPESGNMAAMSVSLFSIGIMAGGILSEFLRPKKISRTKNLKILVLYTLLFSMAGLAVRFNSLNLGICLLLDLLIGTVVGHYCVQLTAKVREISNENNSSIMGFMNFISNFCTHGFLWLSGVLIGYYSNTLQTGKAFEASYLIMFAIFALSSVSFLFVKDDDNEEKADHISHA